MCGICGLWQMNSAVDDAVLQRMSDRIAHRGPDDSGAFFSADRRLGLGFRRLAIIDLSPSGHQPMSNEACAERNGRLWVVYNGEIYNYPSLRKELAARGHEFRSTSDTEVVIHGYEEWGEGVLKRLRGMFAFALWHEREQTLFLARDRLGIKPLYYYWDGQRFAFASEIKSLLALPNVKTDVDRSALWDYFTYLYVPTPKTIYKYIRKLPPAHFLKVSNANAGADRVGADRVRLGADRVRVGADRVRLEADPIRLGTDPIRLGEDRIRVGADGIRDHEYWDVTRWGTSTLSRAEAADAVREKLRETVNAHLIADVPVGVLLSGGLDSTAVTAAAAEAAPHTPYPQLQSFSIGFDVPEYSELNFAQVAAQAFGTHHRTRIVTRGDEAESLAQTLTLFDEPFAETSGLPTLAVSQLAAEHVKVALAGDGGDETMAGYIRYQKWLDLAEADRGRAAARKFFYDDLALGLAAQLTWLPKVQALINVTEIDLRGAAGVERYGRMMSGLKPYQKPKLLPDLAREFRGYDDFWYFRRYWRDDLDPLSCLQYVDLKTYLPDDILTKVDRASMAASLEARVPLLDHEWVELLASLPSEYRFNKSIFRQALDGWLPQEILTRSKKGFSAPVLSWHGAVTRNGARLGGAQLWALKVYQAWMAAQGSRVSSR